MLDKIFPKIHQEGYKFLIIAALITIVLYFLSGFLGLICLLLTVWVYYFFRDPERISINDENYLVSPADGLVLDISEINGPKELGLEKKNFISPYIELPKRLTVEENLKVYGRLYGVKKLKEKIYNLMEKLNLTEFRSRKTGELSSGQKNRVSLAKALINDPEILLLDEPTASLDPDVGDTIRSFIEDFASNKGTTILLASHNMNEVERLCHEVMMMKDGKIIDKGTSNDLINKHGRKNLEEVFLKIVRE